MSANDSNVVSKFDFFLKKKKILKLWFSKVKNFPSSLKKSISAKAEDVFLSDASYRFALKPLKNHLFSFLVSSDVHRALLGIGNMIIMTRLENYNLVVHLKSNTENFFSFSFRLITSEYFFAFFCKIIIIDNTFTKIHSLPCITVIGSNVEITYSNRSKFLNFCYYLSLELKILDLFYFLLIYSHGRRVIQVCFFMKSLREIDFILLVIIIVIKISFTILDSINLNSSKK